MIDSTSPLRQEQATALPSNSIGTRFARQHNWIVLALYSLLAIALTFPLAFQLGTNIRGGASTSDSFLSLWYMWWYGRALEQGLDPSRTNLLYGLLPDVQVLVSSVVNGL